MRRLFAFLLLLGGCTALPEAQCYTEESKFEAYSQQIQDAKPDARFVELTKEQRATFLKSYNNSFPPTAVNYSKIMYLELGGPVVVLVFVQDECVWATHPVPREALMGVIGQAT